MKRIVFILLLLFLAVPQSSFGQAKEKKHKKERKERRWRFYGGMGMGWYNNTFMLQLYPGVLYRFNEKFYSGGGLYYAYYSYNDWGGKARSHIYGGSLLTAYVPVNYFEASMEFQYLFMTQYYASEVYHKQAPSLFLGVGYRMPHVVVGFRYDVLYKEGRSFYVSPFEPFIRVYF